MTKWLLCVAAACVALTPLSATHAAIAAEPQKWCAGAYDVNRGTNFGPCRPTDRKDIQAPGDSASGAGAASSSSSSSSDSGHSADSHGK